MLRVPKETFYSHPQNMKNCGYMPERPVGILSLGILILALAVSAASLAINVLVQVSEVFSLTMVLFGLWIAILGVMRSVDPEQYGGGAFNALSGGVLITTLGAVWLLYGRAVFVEFLIPMLLLVVAILVVFAGIRAWRK